MVTMEVGYFYIRVRKPSRDLATSEPLWNVPNASDAWKLPSIDHELRVYTIVNGPQAPPTTQLRIERPCRTILLN